MLKKFIELYSIIIMIIYVYDKYMTKTHKNNIKYLLEFIRLN